MSWRKSQVYSCLALVTMVEREEDVQTAMSLTCRVDRHFSLLVVAFSLSECLRRGKGCAFLRLKVCLVTSVANSVLFGT